MPHPMTLEPWRALVGKAQADCSVCLSDTLESYLVMLLAHYCDKPALADSVLGMEYLEAQANPSGHRAFVWRDIGDKCLLFSGLFPKRAYRKRVSLSYFIELGQSAYGTASTLAQSNDGLWRALSDNFILLSGGLQATRHESPMSLKHAPDEALALFMETNSPYAKKVFESENPNVVIHPHSKGSLH